MKILLDTHVWIWYLVGSSCLPSGIRREIENTENEIWLSPISVWEALILGEKGRVGMLPDPISWVKKAQSALYTKSAPLTEDVAIQSRSINLSHQDPADRFLASTAIVYNLRLATLDERLIKSDCVATLPITV